MRLALRDRILSTCHDFIFVCIACYFFKMRIAANGTFRLTKQQDLCIVRDTALLSQSFTGYKLGKHQVNLMLFVVVL